jgi:hypothetical protein
MGNFYAKYTKRFLTAFRELAIQRLLKAILYEPRVADARPATKSKTPPHSLQENNMVFFKEIAEGRTLIPELPLVRR